MGGRTFISIIVLLVGLRSAFGEDWPGFHGPRRDNRSSETGLLVQWPDGGPGLVWRVGGLGYGFSSVAVVDGVIYATREMGEVALVRPNPKRLEIVSQFQLPKGGKGEVRARPVVCGGRLYIRHGEFLYAYEIREKQA